MAIHVRRPSDAALADLLARVGTDHLTYDGVGATLRQEMPRGLRRHEWSTVLRSGSFEAAARAVMTWEIHRRSGLLVAADGPAEPGRCVAMAARLPVGWIEVTCRVVEVVDEADRAGFAYGTLPIHPERGEESFLVARNDDGSVTFTVVAVSAPTHPLARLAGPVGDRMQDRAVRRYLRAMEAVVTAQT